MWLVSFVTCIEIIAQVSLTRWSIILLLDVPTLKLKIIIIIIIIITIIIIIIIIIIILPTDPK